MLKKTINYTDFNGENHKEDFYFNLMKSELVEMNFSTGGGLKSFIERITNTRDHMELVKLFKELILKSYGVKSDDGKRFIKNQEVREAFEQSNAYNELFMLLASNEQEAIKFLQGILPADMAAEIPANTTPIS